jgi:hypothetical protein
MMAGATVTGDGYTSRALTLCIHLHWWDIQGVADATSDLVDGYWHQCMYVTTVPAALQPIWSSHPHHRTPCPTTTSQICAIQPECCHGFVLVHVMLRDSHDTTLDLRVGTERRLGESPPDAACGAGTLSHQRATCAALTARPNHLLASRRVDIVHKHSTNCTSRGPRRVN